MLLEKLTSREVAEEVFDSMKEKTSFTSVATINIEFPGKLSRHLYMDLLLWLLEKGAFNTACNMEVVVNGSYFFIICVEKLLLFRGVPGFTDPSI